MSHKLSIGMVAHDAMKETLKSWMISHHSVLSQHVVYATGTTAKVLSTVGEGMEIVGLKSGPLGGDQQLGSMICEGELDVLVFFQDPMTAQPHDVDVKALVRMSTLYNVPIACNPATADLMFSSPLMGAIAQNKTPLFRDYEARVLPRDTNEGET